MSILSTAELTSGGATTLSAPSRASATAPSSSAAAKQAYAEGLEFEQVLVNELAQQLTATVSSGSDGSDGSDGSGGSDGSDGSDGDASTGLLGSAASMYSSLIPQALTTSIISAGGLGIASEIAGALDPSLERRS